MPLPPHLLANTLAGLAVSGLTLYQVSLFLSRAYAHAPMKQRLMAAGRSWISPLEVILDEIPAGATHLDMGCGVGFMLALSTSFRRAGPVVGVDINERALDLARTVIPEGADARLMTLDHWQAAPDGEFDVVTLVDVLHHVPWDQRETFLTDVFSRVRAGGLLIFKDIGQKPWWGAAANFLHDLLLSGERVRLSPIREVEALAARSGLSLIKSVNTYRVYPHELRVFTR